MQTAAEIAFRAEDRSFRFGFVGNTANNLYTRAVPLRRAGLDISMVLHPHDRYLMGDPSWEEFGGEIQGDQTDIELLRAKGVQLPQVPEVYRDQVLGAPINNGGNLDTAALLEAYPFLRLLDVVRYAAYLSFAPTVARLRHFDALLATQAPYLAYLSRRPYLVTQVGGDMWYECSRADTLGSLQRRSFSQANAVLASNPWIYAHARRYRLRNVVYLPLMLDESIYCPGSALHRKQWAERVGGDFFVLCTARFDRNDKGSHTAMEGFARFCRRYPMARLIVVAWGPNKDAWDRFALEYDVADRVLVLPMAGKKRVVQYLRSADCLLDQFVLGYFGATALEAMACGVPVIMRLERAQYDALCETGAPPVLHAETPEEICDQLSKLVDTPEYKKSAAREHREWFVRNHGSERWRAAYRDLLIATALGHRFSFESSPLCDPLSAAERAYHREGLRRAPSFPSYA